MSSRNSPLVIGIAGGTGSGKTTVANAILQSVGVDRIVYLPHDAYYRDQNEKPLEQRVKVNFDHPDSLETDLMIRHVLQLKDWQAIDMPVYDFTTHTRTARCKRVEPKG